MYPQQPQAYAPAPPMPQYPQQPPAYPAAPPVPQYPQQTYPPQPMAYPQGYPQAYAPPAPPAPPLPTGTLDSFYEQPSAGGGPSLKFMDANRQPQIGKMYAGIVARPVTNADVRAQTDNNGRVQTYKDGRPKFVLVVPLLLQPSQEFPDGQAGWWVKGQARDELARAMAEAGAPAGPPESGAGITVQLVGVRPVPNMSPAYQYRITYMRPQGAAPGPSEFAAVPQPPATYPAPVAQPVPQALPQQPAQPQYAPPAAPPQPVAQPAMAVSAPAPAAAPQAAAPTAAPAGFSPEQADLFARLTGQQAVPQG